MKKQTAQSSLPRHHRWLIFGSGMLAAGSVAAGPSVFYNGPVTPVMPLAEREAFNAQTNSAQVFIPAYENKKSDLPEIFRQGPFNIRPHLNYQFLYGTGVQAGPGVQTDTIIQSVSPGVLLEIGKHWSLDYTPTFSFYSSDQFSDSVDHAVVLIGGTQYNDWTFGLTQTYSKTSQPLVETGTQSDQQSFITGLSASRILNDKFSLDFGLNQRIQDTSGFQGSRDWSGSTFLNYQLWPRLTIGVGTVLGYVNLDTGPDQTYEQLQATTRWRITDKLGVSVNVGGEDRQFLASGAGNLLSPIMSASLQYEPRRRTQLMLSVNRSVSPSLFGNAAATETTSFSLNLSQQLFKKFRLELGGSYNLTEYAGAVTSTGGLPTVNLDRQDNYYAFNARLSHPFRKHGTIALIYQYTDNKSTDALYQYQSTQIGCQIGYSF